MLFMATWKGEHNQWLGVLRYWSSLTPDQRADVGKGVTLIGRWHDPAARSGAAIFETDAVMALQGYAAQWSTYLDIKVSPVVDDEQAAVIASEVVAAQSGS
jgi:hypothetical protein